MRPFEYSRGRAVGDVVRALTARRRPLAGGTDLLPLLKSDIQSVAELVDIKTAGLERGIEETERGVRIGALATLAEIAASPLLAARSALLGQAAATTATAQIRNRATLGGNLLQRPRCWYFRNPRSDCWLKGGDECFAVDGRNEHHAVFGDSSCRAAHPSDLAGCLLALDAVVTLLGPRGSRRLPLADFYALPEPARRSETVIGDDELLVCVDMPGPPDDLRTVYLKAMDRKVWAFALAGIALALRKTAGQIETVRIVANGVAPIPWRLAACEQRLLGSSGDASAAAAAADLIAEGAAPLSSNAYKLALLRGLLKRALETVA